MRQIVDYILENKQWLFSGVGVFVLSGMILIARRLFRRKPLPQNGDHRQSATATHGHGSTGVPLLVPKNWQAILPRRTRHKFVSQTKTAVPLGLQSFTFEYGPNGHANALILKGAVVRAEIQLTCQIVNLYKALFAANDYALNVLLPTFVLQARGVLERFPLNKLRAAREEVAREIASQVSPQFYELGVKLESVTIGALDKIEQAEA